MAADLEFPTAFSEVFTQDPGTVLSPAYVQLPAGVSTIQVTWNLPYRLGINLSPSQTYTTRVEVAALPAGAGIRSIVLPGVGVRRGELRYLSLLHGAPMGTDGRATVQVVTVPLR